VRDLLRDAYPDASITEAADAIEVLARLSGRAWDLVLLDVLMPGADILDVIAQTRIQAPRAAVLMLTGATELAYVTATMKAGADGLVHKHRAADELLQAIAKVAAGGTYLHPETAAAIARSLYDTRAPLLHELLSERELEIFRLIAQGRTVKEVAAELDRSGKTVATYLGRIRAKTGLSSHVEIARYALQHRLVE
jgi:DNA-binding NarL/FixJ family response regulator